jgi:hypothetical protein
MMDHAVITTEQIELSSILSDDEQTRYPPKIRREEEATIKCA